MLREKLGYIVFVIEIGEHCAEREIGEHCAEKEIGGTLC